MKSLSVRLGVILFIIGLIISGNIEVWGADWRAYYEDDNGFFYYDAEFISGHPKSIVRVWEKMILKEERRDLVIVRLRKSGFPINENDELDYILELYQINCVDKEFRLLSHGYYDKKGKVLYSFPGEVRRDLVIEPQWFEIPSNSQPEKLYKAVCE